MVNSNTARAVPQIADSAPSRTVRYAQNAHLCLNRAVLGGIAVQFYTVALHALGINGLAAHAVLGWAMISVAALSLGAGVLGRMTNARLTLPLAVLALTITQALLALVSRSAFPMIYALHGANAVLILAVAYRTDRLALRQRAAYQI